MFPWWLSVLVVVGGIFSAVDMYRRQQALGIKRNWHKLLTTGFLSIFVTLCALGVLYLGLASGRDVVGYVGFAVVFILGTGALVFYVNRRWPIPGSRK